MIFDGPLLKLELPYYNHFKGVLPGVCLEPVRSDEEYVYFPRNMETYGFIKDIHLYDCGTVDNLTSTAIAAVMALKMFVPSSEDMSPEAVNYRARCEKERQRRISSGKH